MDAYKRLLGWLWKPKYYYIHLPVTEVHPQDIYVKTKYREVYASERELVSMLGEVRYEVLLVADEPELEFFSRGTYGNSFIALQSMLETMGSEKLKWIGDGYQIKVHSGRTYTMRVSHNEFIVHYEADAAHLLCIGRRHT
jgi:hypothetical protein